ncbi:hypothetical protein PRUPE_5G205000 [Prunus persica]|uniref:Uncharacterized protein n=1 Tax=Prunus persica TaxID=3760 RepID=M5WXY2_PRUPE|nr:hypothetical protein PRUPE_5G205000 [Prunus persica]
MLSTPFNFDLDTNRAQLRPAQQPSPHYLIRVRGIPIGLYLLSCVYRRGDGCPIDKTVVSQLTTRRLMFQQKKSRRLVASYTTDVAPPPPPQTSALRRSVSKRASTRAPYKYPDQLLPLAWSHDSLTTLKLICNLRDDDYDLGKYYLQAFYRTAIWLHHNHPKTLACNADTIVSEFSKSVGTMDDLVEILYRLSKKDNNNTIAMANSNSDYRFLHDRVSDIFADYLREDIQNLEKQQEEILSSAAFVCPPVGSSLDRATLLCESIARKVFPIESQGLQEAHYADKVRDRLSKELLYLEDLKASKIELEADALLPHEIIGYVNDGDVGQAAELQWKAMVEEVYLKQGKFSNCLVACNVSSGLFKDVSAGLAVLVSQLGEEPWKGKEKGYGDAVPQIVFWQLDHYGTASVPCRRRPGVATLGGFSNNLFKSFLDNDGEVGPHHVMEAAISGPQYQNLAVVD